QHPGQPARSGPQPRAAAGRGLGLGGRGRDPDGRQPRQGAAFQDRGAAHPDRARRRLRAGGAVMSSLENVGSIKIKLGVLVIAAATVAALVAAVGGLADVPLALTLPITLLLALVVTQLLAAGMVAPLQQMTVAAQGMA